jgi:hypothetical protein
MKIFVRQSFLHLKYMSFSLTDFKSDFVKYFKMSISYYFLNKSPYEQECLVKGYIQSINLICQLKMLITTGL